jgi:hypothetical protein
MIGKLIGKIVGNLVGRLVGDAGVKENPAGYILLENGDKLILEDGSGNLLLEG